MTCEHALPQKSIALRFLDLSLDLRTFPPTALGFVYLMRNNRNGYYKIGFSINPSAREDTLQSEEPDITMIRQWPGTKTDERALHAKFEAQRIRGEWFKLSDADISDMDGVALSGAGSRMSGALDGHPAECAEWLRAVPKA